MAQGGLNWLHELCATARSPEDSGRYRYCRLRAAPGADGVPESYRGISYLFEVDEAGVPVRQLQIYDVGEVTYRFDLDHPYCENATGKRFGGGLRSDPLSAEEIESSAITHEQFEHAWLTGHLGERTTAQYRDELLVEAYEDVAMLWEAWAVAERWYPYQTPGTVLILAERSIRELLDQGLIELVALEIGSERVAPTPVPLASVDAEALMLDRRSWMPPPIAWFHITATGIDLKNRGIIRSD